MPEPPVPANVVNAIQVVDLGQDGTGQSYEQGLCASGRHGNERAHVSIQSTFSQVVWELGDQAGLAWDSTAATVGHNHVYAYAQDGHEQRGRSVLSSGARRVACRAARLRPT